MADHDTAGVDAPETVSGEAAGHLAVIAGRGRGTAFPPSVAPLRGARGELSRLNSLVEAASAELARCNEPVARLNALIGDVQRAEQDLVARRNRYDSEIGHWISSGCRGERPVADPDLVAAERTLGEAAENARAARNALPQRDAEAQAAAARVNQIARKRAEVLLLAALECVTRYAGEVFAPLCRQYIQAEYRMRCVEDALALQGNHGAADQVRQIIAATKWSVSPPADNPAAGQGFISALQRDPTTRLE
jgi:hypothetical protein